MAVGVTVGQSVVIALLPKCADGTPASLNGIPVWESSDTNKAVIASTTGNGCGATVNAVGAGTCVITATCAGQNGAIVKTVDLNITAQYATQVDVKVSVS